MRSWCGVWFTDGFARTVLIWPKDGQDGKDRTMRTTTRRTGRQTGQDGERDGNKNGVQM